jgi:hypothetical protein
MLERSLRSTFVSSAEKKKIETQIHNLQKREEVEKKKAA